MPLKDMKPIRKFKCCLLTEHPHHLEKTSAIWRYKPGYTRQSCS